ncbi:MAG: putative glycolipid-binding domain-containing protein [Myxococcaceae bacterium]
MVRDWRSREGTERFELLQTATGWALQGHVVQGAAETRYLVFVDDRWETERAEIAVSGRTLLLEVKNGQWLVDGVAATALAGCIDVDLSLTPSTNTLPLRRLQLPVGASSGEVRAAWVRFPELTVEVLSQEYRRESEHVYRYRSGQLEFEARLEVDDEQLVVRYGDLWALA